MSQPLRPQFNEFIRSPEGPAGICLPDTILSVYSAIIEHEKAQGRTASNGFYFGGLFTSLLRGEKPRDIDIAVCAPELVDLARQVKELRSRPAESYSEYEEINEEVDYLRNVMAPWGNALRLNLDSMTEVRDPGHVGPCFQTTGMLTLPGYSTTVDILCTANPFDGLSVLSYPPDAPIRCIGYECDKDQYLYHRDFEDHARRWVYEPFDPSSVRPKCLQKARDKGMTLVL